MGGQGIKVSRGSSYPEMGGAEYPGIQELLLPGDGGQGNKVSRVSHTIWRLWQVPSYPRASITWRLGAGIRLSKGLDYLEVWGRYPGIQGLLLLSGGYGRYPGIQGFLLPGGGEQGNLILSP